MACIILLLAVGIRCAAHGAEKPPLVQSAATAPAADSEAKPAATLKVMTLNLAHGRGEGFHQALEKKATIEAHLNDVAAVLRRERPDVAAFQEADGPSIWSGKFNHVEHLARAGGLAYQVRGENVHAMKLSYGTALASRLPLGDVKNVTFAPSPPTPSKGFTIARVAWPGRPDFQLDVVSVHLDFSRESVRKRQVQEVVEQLRKRQGPLVVMGDFNSDWFHADSSPRNLAEQLKLQAFEPESSALATFPATKKRLDWILVSKRLAFAEYKTLPDPVSDHRGVVAVLKITSDDQFKGPAARR